jgi:hypothetical protein
MLEPLREVGQELLRERGQLATTWCRLATWCRAKSAALNRAALHAGRGELEHAVQFLPAFAAAVRWLASNGHAHEAITIARRLDAPLYLCGRWREREAIMAHALEGGGPRTSERAWLHALASRKGPLSRADMAHLEHAIDIGTELGDDAVVAYARHLRGIRLWWEGRLGESLDDHAWAARRLRELNHPAAFEAAKYEAIALVQAGRSATGVSTLHEVASAYERNGQRALHGHTLAYLGHCHRFLGDDTSAAAIWLDAAAILDGIGNDATGLHVHCGLAEIALRERDLPSAEHHLRCGLDRVERGRHDEYVGWAWAIAVQTAMLAGDTQRALNCGRRAASVAPAVIPGEEARIAWTLADLALHLGDVATAARLVAIAKARRGPCELPLVPAATVGRTERIADAVAPVLADAGGALEIQWCHAAIAHAAAPMFQREPTRSSRFAVA